jgi:uncharacterized LabA/DUF88 family protein
MEKVQLFLDYANINRAANDLGYTLNYEVLLHDYLVSQDEGRILIDAFAYVPINPRQEHKMDSAIDNLWNSGYFVNSKVGTIAGDGYKCDFDVEIAMDIIKIAHQTKPDIIILASGDSDFIPIIKELRKMGIRVEVAAFQKCISRHLSLVSSGFIDIEYFMQADEEIVESEDMSVLVRKLEANETKTLTNKKDQ